MWHCAVAARPVDAPGVWKRQVFGCARCLDVQGVWKHQVCESVRCLEVPGVEALSMQCASCVGVLDV